MAKTFENTTAVGGLKKVTDGAWERETTITYSDAEDVAYITTSRRPDITALLKNPGFTLTSDQAPKDGNPRIIMGTLTDHGLITFRRPRRKGGSSEQATPKANLPKGMVNAAKCGAKKKDGTICQMVAKKDTGKCRWHS